jgi:hypothetical protein
MTSDKSTAPGAKGGYVLDRMSTYKVQSIELRQEISYWAYSLIHSFPRESGRISQDLQF